MSSARVATAPRALGGKTVAPTTGGVSIGQYLRQMASLGYFVGVGLLLCPLSAVAMFFFRRFIPATFGQRLIRGLFRTWLRFSQKIGVFEISLPDEAKLADLRGAIVTPNHPSQVDAVLLLSILPRPVCIMRASLMRSPFLGGIAQMARFIANDRGPALIREGTRKLHGGENLLIFPEGTRTVGSDVNSFKSGFALLATKTGATIQTIFIEREGPYLSKDVSLLTPTPLPIRLRVHLGDQFIAMPEETPQALAHRLEDYFRARLVNTGEHILLRTPPAP